MRSRSKQRRKHSLFVQGLLPIVTTRFGKQPEQPFATHTTTTEQP
jgi:hypothetical protein